MPPSSDAVRAGAGLSGLPETHAAALAAANGAASALASRCDLALVFVSEHHADRASVAARAVREVLAPGTLLAVTGSAVLGHGLELESAPGVSVLALSLPGVTLTPFSGDDLTIEEPAGEEAGAELATRAGFGPTHRASLLFADPYSVPLAGLLARLDLARGRGAGPIVGGAAGATGGPGRNALVLNDRVLRQGLVGVSLAGDLRVDAIVSQGVKPVGPAMTVTRARNNLIQEIDHRPAWSVVEQIIEGLPARDRPLLASGMLVGRAIDEAKPRHGRGDFVIGRVIGVDAASGGVAVDAFTRPGQIIRMHLRDADTASSDLSLLLDAQSLHERPAAAMVVTCAGRGSALFGTPHHDARAVARAFQPAPPGELLAKAGAALGPHGAGVPSAGFFAQGEIGPVAGRTFLHGFTACVALFRSAPLDDASGPEPRG
ncbi:MAG: FIST C-terminal domain-containing protein [Phycisphaerales bacterium]|nr:FIST C-terminal domain-containing protein [Phycisphaerales bacterium]